MTEVNIVNSDMGGVCVCVYVCLCVGAWEEGKGLVEGRGKG